MPARNSSMELSSPSAEESAQPNRRRSGRVTKAPEFLSPSATGGKRKHDDIEEDLANGASEDEDEDEQESDGEPGEEEVREKKRKARKAQQSDSVQKRVKRNGISGSLPMRSAASAPKKSRKAIALNAGKTTNIDGLYEVLGGEATIDHVAEQWTRRFNAHQSQAVQELINLVLKASGCEHEVGTYDIEDPDHAAEKLTEIVELFQKQNVADYPIIARNKGSGPFKKALTSFFEKLMVTLDTTGLLYDEPDLIENMSVWIASMSSASHRALRHTATIVALAIVDGLCTVGKASVERKAKLQRQSDGEGKKSKKNQARIADFNEQIKQISSRKAKLDEIVKDWYDTVFVHRYRDIDAKIRHDCIVHLSNWIDTYTDYFLDAIHLRYLGWLLADPQPVPRHEVVKQLHKMYKDPRKSVALGQFTERFKDRYIEMATRDAEPGIRASATEMLDTLRELGLLDPEDIDTIGKLIFDAEPRVRKAIVPFFAAAVQDSFADKVDTLGGELNLEENLPAVEADDYEGLRLEWLKFKSLAELLQSFDPDDVPFLTEQGVNATMDALAATATDSRFSLAAQAFYSQIDELANWQVLAGYLLFDASQRERSRASGIDNEFKGLCKLDEKEEAILLDILNVSVRMSVAEVIQEGKAEKTKKTKKELQIVKERQEATAQSLAAMIPKLLRKFGVAPEAASAVLRLQLTLNLDVFQELRQDSTTYAALLDDIQKQFMSHKSRDVVAEASNALLHARSFSAVGEITEEKLRTLWDETVYALIGHCRGEDLETRGGIDTKTLLAISATILRLSSLAGISDCIEAFETPRTYVSTAGRRKKQSSERSYVPISLLLELMSRGRPGPHVDPEVDQIETELVSNLIKALLCYFLWHVRRLQNNTASASAQVPSDSEILGLAERRDIFAQSLFSIITTRHGHDSLRIIATEALLDLHTLLTIQLDPRKSPSPAVKSLSQILRPDHTHSLLNVFAAVEREYAKKAHLKLEDPADDEDPEDLSDEEADSDDEEGGEAIPRYTQDEDEAVTQARMHRAAERRRAILLAEDRLCSLAGKMVFAVIAKVVDSTSSERDPGPIRKRLVRNKARLGQNFKEVVTALDKPVAKGKKGGAIKVKTGVADANARGGKNVKSKEIIVDDDENEDDEGEEHEDDEDEETLRRKGLVDERDVSARDLEVDNDMDVEREEESVVGD